MFRSIRKYQKNLNGLVKRSSQSKVVFNSNLQIKSLRKQQEKEWRVNTESDVIAIVSKKYRQKMTDGVILR